jgi:hypothetical protein
VIVTRGAADPVRVLPPAPPPFPAALTRAAGLTCPVPCPPPEHPAATSASTATAATPATRRTVIVLPPRIPAAFPRTTFCIHDCASSRAR